MLNLVRKHADSWMIKTILWTIVFAFVVTIFFGWGMGGPSSGRSGVVAVVDGEEIFLSEFDQSFNNLINFYRQQFPDQFSEKLIERLNLRSEALDRLILSKLMLVQADRLDIRVSNEELATRIRTLPAFKKDDNFDQSRYQNFLNFNRLTPREFEDNLRQQVRREKVENFIKSNIKISPDEVREAFREENEKVKLSYVSFSKQHFENTAPPSEEDLQQFFEKHKADFEIPERVVVQYVRLTPQMVADQIKIRDEDLEDYYQTHQAEFHVKKQYPASHILFRVKP
ncbi:MAG: peptidylprolyl isomerase, partial [Nitrospinaceae bacterium]